MSWVISADEEPGDRPSGKTPNIVLILSDDQGYADVSFHPESKPEVRTPHIDALSREGVVFTNAYTSGSLCSPTRAGIMLGAYQQRVGIYSAGQGGRGFNPDLLIFPAFLPDTYSASAIGKWHLGLDTDYPALKWHAMNRGFDECYKFMGRGGHDYWKLVGARGSDYAPIYRNKNRLKSDEYSGYLTTRLTEEAVDFIERKKDQPFFLYLAYNAVHSPAQAPDEDIQSVKKEFPGLTHERAILMAMLKHLDDGVGSVVNTLKKNDLWHNTLMVFMTDNGGARNMRADTGSLKGFKGTLSEGGIRTPFIMSWPAGFPGKRRIDTPVILLDLLPTVIDAIGGSKTTNTIPFDGQSLLPLLAQNSPQNDQEDSRTLFWHNGSPSNEWAVRQGSWKAHGFNHNFKIYNLDIDPSETHDLTAQFPEIAEKLHQQHLEWHEDVRKSSQRYGTPPLQRRF